MSQQPLSFLREYVEPMSTSGLGSSRKRQTRSPTSDRVSKKPIIANSHPRMAWESSQPDIEIVIAAQRLVGGQELNDIAIECSAGPAVSGLGQNYSDCIQLGGGELLRGLEALRSSPSRRHR